MTMFYVYEWVRPDYNLAFYVGKGSNNRARSMHDRNKDTLRVVDYLISVGMKHEVRIIARFTNEDNSLDFEQERISFLEPLGELTNLKYTKRGRSGTVGYKHSDEVRRKLSIIATEVSKREDVILKRKQSLSSPEVVARKRASLKLVFSTEEHKQKRAAAESRPETKLKRSMSQKEAQNRPDVRAKHSKNNSGHGNPKAKSVIELSELRVFLTIKEAQEYYGANNIQSVCAGRLKTSGGKKFMYLKDYQKTLKSESAE